MACGRSSSCFLLLVVLLAVLSSPATAQETGKQLLVDTCSDTPYPDLCVATFLTNPQSLKAFYKDLGKIITELFLANATSTLVYIDQEFEKEADVKIKVALERCQRSYGALIHRIQTVMGNFENYHFDPVVGALNSAKNKVALCGGQLKKAGLQKSPVSEKNALMYNLAGNAFVFIIDLAV